MRGGWFGAWEGDSEPLRDGVDRFLTTLPRDAKVYGIKLDRSGKPEPESIANVASELVLVEMELEANTEPKRA